MNAITLLQPQKIVFGTGCIQNFCDDYLKLGFHRLFVLTAPPILPLITSTLDALRQKGVEIRVFHDITRWRTSSELDSSGKGANGWLAFPRRQARAARCRPTPSCLMSATN